MLNFKYFLRLYLLQLIQSVYNRNRKIIKCDLKQKVINVKKQKKKNFSKSLFNMNTNKFIHTNPNQMYYHKAKSTLKKKLNKEMKL